MEQVDVFVVRVNLPVRGWSVVRTALLDLFRLLMADG